MKVAERRKRQSSRLTVASTFRFLKKKKGEIAEKGSGIVLLKGKGKYFPNESVSVKS